MLFSDHFISYEAFLVRSILVLKSTLFALRKSFSQSFDSTVGITTLFPSKLLDTEMVGVLTVTDAEDISTVLVVLLSETLEDEKTEG